MFIIVTTLVMLLKHETDATTPDEEDTLEDASTQSVAEAYMQLWRIVHLPAVLSLIAALLTMKVQCTEDAVIICWELLCQTYRLHTRTPF